MVRQFEPERVLEVIQPEYGSAYRIGGRLVLTAAHLFQQGNSSCRVRLRLHSPEQKFQVEYAKVVWQFFQEDIALDIALVELPDSIPSCEAIIFGKLPETKIAQKYEFEMFGYPKWAWTPGKKDTETGQDKSPDAEGRHIEGSIYQADTSRHGWLVLEPKRLPESISQKGSDWGGCSGAAIICDGLVIAVQSRHQNPARPASLEASPLWKIYDNKQWCDLLTQHGINPTPQIVHGKSVCPYVGLRAFTEEEKNYFHGREELSKELASKLLAHKDCLFVIGASGSGKSSSVQAGLLKKLKLDKKVKFETFSPGGKEKPQEMLTQALNNLGNCTQENLNIVFIDQFEEVYSLCYPDEKIEFVERLKNLIKNFPFKRITLIIATRSDFYGHLLDSFGNDLLKKQVNVIPMNVDEAKLAINEPAKKVGLSIESGLEERIIEDISDVEQISLPLLAVTLEKLWQKAEKSELTHKDYGDIAKNGIKNVLEEHANDTINELKNELKNESVEHLTRHVFTRLINYGLYDSPNTRRRAFPIKKLAFKHPENSNDFDIIKKIITKFANKRLLVTDKSNDNDKEGTVEIVHDFLIYGWGKLKEWTQQAGENLLLLRRIELDASDWIKQGKRKNDLLLQGSRLKTVEDLLKQENVINEDEVFDYVKACKDRDEEEQLENEIITSIANARRYLIENKNLDALTELIEIGERLQKLSNINGISTKKRLEFLITFGQIFDQIAEKNSFEGHTDWIYAVSVSPDDKIIASSSRDKTIKLWSFDGNLLQTLKEHQHEVIDISFSTDGTMLASASYDNTIKIWKKSTDHNCQTNWILHRTLKGHRDHVLGVSFSPDSKIIGSASQDKTVRLWNKEGVTLKILNGHKNGVSNVAFSRDGKLIASASKDKTVRLWEIKSYQLKIDRLKKYKLRIYKLKSTSEMYFTKVSSVSFGSDNKTLISSNEDKNISFWDIEKNVPSVIRSKEHKAKVSYATFSPDYEIIAASGQDGVITLWDKDQNFVSTLKGHRDSVTKVSFTTDSKTLVSGSLDGTIKIWDCTGKFQGHSNKIVKIDFSSDGEKIATASQDDIKIDDKDDKNEKYSQNVIVKLWKVTGEPLTIDDNGRVWEIKFNLTSTSQYKFDIKLDIKFNPKQRNIAVAINNEVKIYNFKLIEIDSFSKYQSHIHSISFNPEGTEIAIGYLDGQVILWDIENDKPKYKYLDSVKYSKQVNMVAFSPQKEGQDRKIVTAGADGTVKLLYLNDNRIIPINYQGAVSYVGFSPDGGVIATASFKKDEGNKSIQQIALWYIKDGSQRILKRNSHTTVMSIGFIDDGKIVASVNEDQTIEIWDIATGNLLQTIQGNDNSLIGAACIFSSQNDKSAIAVANSDENRINLWSLSLEELLKNSTNQICDYTKRLNLEEKAKTEEME